jgi:hypothetical protein
MKKLTYFQAHYQIKKLYGRPEKCEGKDCSGKSIVFEWAVKKEILNRGYWTVRREEWLRLCKSCHIRYDKDTAPGRYESLKLGRGDKSEELKERISDSLKGRSLGKKHRRRISKGMKGRKLSKEHRRNIRKALKGRKITWKNKIRNGMLKRKKQNVDKG